MSINFPNNNLTDGDVYVPPESPEAIYVYNAARGIWVGGDADFGNHPAVGALLDQPEQMVQIGQMGQLDAVVTTVIRGHVGSRGATGTGLENVPVGYTGSSFPFRGTKLRPGYTGSRGEVGPNGPTGSVGKSLMKILRNGRFYADALSLNFSTNSNVQVTKVDEVAQIRVSTDPVVRARKNIVIDRALLSSVSRQVVTIDIDSPSYLIYSIETSAGAQVTIYSTSTGTNSDLSRKILADPAPNNDIIAEAITLGTGTSKVEFTPAVFGANNETEPVNRMYVRVVNNSGVAQPQLRVTITYLPLLF